MKQIKDNWIEHKVEPAHQRDGWVWVEVIAEIRENNTGEVREYSCHEILDVNGNETFPDVFNWEENNNSCDCNRRVYFKRANDELKDSDWDIDCSDGLYSVNLKNAKDGVIYYKEF